MELAPGLGAVFKARVRGSEDRRIRGDAAATISGLRSSSEPRDEGHRRNGGGEVEEL